MSLHLKDLFWNPKRNRNYNIVKSVSILYGTLTIPLDVYIGYLLGTENFVIAFPLIALTTIIAVLDAYAWSWVLEEMGKEKIVLGLKNGKKSAKKNK